MREEHQRLRDTLVATWRSISVPTVRVHTPVDSTVRKVGSAVLPQAVRGACDRAAAARRAAESTDRGGGDQVGGSS